MSQMHAGNTINPDDSDQAELERLLLQGVSLQDTVPPPTAQRRVDTHSMDEDDDTETSLSSDYQGALGLFAEAAQDMATAGVELGLGRHFACVDFCNQAAEKAAQSVSLLRFGRRTTYNHDLGALGTLVGAPLEIQEDMGQLTPFHPEAFYADTPPEEADEVVSAEQASYYVQCARRVVRWARDLVLSAS